MSASGFGIRISGLLAVLLFLSGCGSLQMKGTPFYTGEYETRVGPSEDRVNLWPLLYYRNPALSVLWPIGELTDDHFAIRPLMSVYGLDEEEKTYNVLWPIAQFDQATGQNRIFPVYWDKDLFCVFPLYWHSKDPFGARGGYNGLFPLWSLLRDRHGYDAYAFGPIFHVKDRNGEKAWHLWPVAGQYKRKNSLYRFAAWPLGHQWESRSSEGSALVPLYYYGRDGNRRTFLSLPYSSGKTGEQDGWQLVPPLMYRSTDRNGTKLITPLYAHAMDADGEPDWRLVVPAWFSRRKGDTELTVTPLGGRIRTPGETRWMALPLLAGGRHGTDSGSVWAGGPLIHADWSPTATRHHVLPLYLRSKTSDGSLFASLPWSCGRRGTNETWQLAPPLFYRSETPDKSLFASLPWSSGRRGTNETWQLAPPLYYRMSKADAGMFATPLYAEGWSGTETNRWRTVLPLFYHRQTSEDESILITCLGGVRTDARGRSWLAYPLLAGGRTEEDRGSAWALTPLIHARWTPESRSHHVLPLYYWNGEDRCFVSPVAASWQTDSDGRCRLVPPLLSWMTSDGRDRDLWAAGGLARWQWGPNARHRHVFPLFYSDVKEDRFLSPLWTSWDSRNGTTWTVPPLLSGYSRDRDQRALTLLLGLSRNEWTGDRFKRGYVFPLYYNDANRDRFLSPLWTSWKSGSGTTWTVPPLLSGYSRDQDKRALTLLLGASRNEWTGDRFERGYVFPFYWYDKDDSFYTPLFGWNKDKANGFVYPLTPLTGIRRGRDAGSWLFPFYSHRRNRETGNSDGWFLWGNYTRTDRMTRAEMLPLFGYRNRKMDDEPEDGRPRTGGKRFWSLPATWYRNDITTVHRWNPHQPTNRPALLEAHTKKHGTFPLWSYTNTRIPEEKTENTDGRLLLWLYDYKHEVGPRGETRQDYTRARVLLRLWHYERLDGDVSVDVFPAITYDRKKDGFRKVSFLWRLLRYENGPEGRKLDLMFVPLVRSEKGSPQ